MCMKTEELKLTSDEDLLKFFQRSIELSDGKSPFDTEQIKAEILSRMSKLINHPTQSKREVGDEHDQFS